MSTQFNRGTISKPSAGGPVASSASYPDTQVGNDVAPPAQVKEARSNPGLMPSTCHFAPFDEHLNELVETPRWQKDLDDHFTSIFKESVLSDCPIDDMATRALQIIESPTRARMRGLALAVFTHWIRMQFRCKDANVCAPELVTLISRITARLGRMSVHAQKDFLDELSYLCIEKLRLTWRWYAAVVIRGVFPVPRKSLFKRVMAVVAMISYLFHGGQLRYGAVLDGLGYIATMSPWPDAVAIIYALLHKLGPRFALEPAGWHFVQRLLVNLLPLTVGRVDVDPLCQLVSAINTLVAEWHNSTQATLYLTHPKADSQSHAHHSQK